MDGNNSSNFSVVTTTTPSKKSKRGLIIGAIIVLFLAISIPAGVYLVKQQQDIREKAEAALLCPAAEACPVAGDLTLLTSCYGIADGEAPREISCANSTNVGEKALCGATQYCCPSLSAAWITDLTACEAPVSTETPIPTETPTASASATPKATPTASASASPSTRATASSSPTLSASSSATLAPIPVTGTSWPTILGAGLGILVIIGSILLVL